MNPKDKAKATRISTDIPALKAALAADGGTVLNPSTALDTNVFVVEKKTATTYHLTTLSSLKDSASKLVFGAPPECPTYSYCLPGLKAVYGLSFKSFVATDESGPIAVADLKTARSKWSSSSPARASCCKTPVSWLWSTTSTWSRLTSSPR